jgi:hypothetical protein
VKPYWSSPDRSIVVFNARWEDVLAAGAVTAERAAEPVGPLFAPREAT